MNGAVGGDNCVETRVNYRTVTVPCTKTQCKLQTYKVPRTVSKTLQRDVPYTETKIGQRTQQYTVTVPKTKYRTEMESYQVPVPRTQTIMVPVTKKVPVVKYVDRTHQEPRTYTKTEMQTRQRPKVVPYTVQVPETRSRTVPYSYTVQKTRKEPYVVNSTVYDTRMRKVCSPVTKMVTKSVPYTTVHAKAASGGGGRTGIVDDRLVARGNAAAALAEA